MVFNPEIHHRQSIRLRDYDYSRTGAYFVTICAWQKECLFGEVIDGDMRLNPYGEIVQDEWRHTPTMRPNVELDEFVIMPNHFHAILCIRDVGAHCMRPGGVGPDWQNEPRHRAHVGAPLRRKSDSIGSIIAGFKSAVTKRINQSRNNPGAPVWQRNYYDRVIRDEQELAGIRRYIAENPARWEEDENYQVRITPAS